MHTRPYFEDFLLQICLNTNFSLVFALNVPLTSLVAYTQYLVNGKPGLKCLKGRVAALWSHSHYQDGQLMTRAVGRSLLVMADELIFASGEKAKLTCLQPYCEDDIVNPTRDNLSELLELYFTLKNIKI